MTEPVIHVPLVDLKAQHRRLAAAVRASWDRVLESAEFLHSKEVASFEREYADHLGVRHCIGVANGTDALELALRSVDVGPGSEVILPANTFVSSALAVVRAGATPVLVDIDLDGYVIDCEQVERCLGPRTKVVLPVHLYGQVAPLEPLEAELAGRGVMIVEDAAQAHGATRHGRSAGGLGLVAGTSFYPTKNLGSCGHGGAVLTDSDEVAAIARHLHNYASEPGAAGHAVGFNSHLQVLQAAVLRVKLPHLALWNARRQEAAARYEELLQNLEEVVRPRQLPGNDHVWHLYVVRVPNRDVVLRRLREAGIGAAVHYSVPLHLHAGLRHLGHGTGAFPVAETASRSILSLPIYPEITAHQQERVVEELGKALR